MLHDQDGRHAHTVNNLKNLLLWNLWTDFNKTWYVASGLRLAHHIIVSINYDHELTLTN